MCTTSDLFFLCAAKTAIFLFKRGASFVTNPVSWAFITSLLRFWKSSSELIASEPTYYIFIFFLAIFSFSAIRANSFKILYSLISFSTIPCLDSKALATPLKCALTKLNDFSSSFTFSTYFSCSSLRFTSCSVSGSIFSFSSFWTCSSM